MFTDLAVERPKGCYVRITSRSCLSLAYEIDVMAGTVDPDYRGNVGIILCNFSGKPFEVEAGQAIAQIILERVYEPRFEEVEELSGTARNTQGWGSTSNYQGELKEVNTTIFEGLPALFGEADYPVGSEEEEVEIWV